MHKTGIFSYKRTPIVNIGLISLLLVIYPVFGARAATTTCGTSACTVEQVTVNTVNCRLSAISSAYGNKCVSTCGNDASACYSGQKLVTKTISISGCGDVTYTDCETDTDNDDDDNENNSSGDTKPEIGGLLCQLSDGSCDGSAATPMANCKTTQAKCFGGTTFTTCAECDSGYTEKTTFESIDGCSNSFTKNTCVMSCTTDDDCKSLDSIVDGKNGIKTHTTGYCNTSKECAKKTLYTCMAGYSGSPLNALRGCTRCPAGYYCPGGATKNSCAENTNTPTATSVAGSDDISDCYVPTSQQYQNEKGIYSFEENCYWPK